MSDSSDSSDHITPTEYAGNAHLNFLPAKSREKYLKVYTVFNEWRDTIGAKSYSEDVMLTYFKELSKTKQPSTIWSVYSMLKATLKARQDIHIENYSKLAVYLRSASEGYKPKRSRVFTHNNVEKFLDEAPDYNFLCTKVGLIIGINGACRSNELMKLTVSSIEKHSDNLLLINLPNTKTRVDRSFVIRGPHVKIVEKYLALRPVNTTTDRFFIKYGNGRCVRQPMGINKIGAIPREVATFLKLPNPQLYTGHCLRRTSTTLLAESYIENSIENKTEIFNRIVKNIRIKNPEDPLTRPSTSKQTIKDEWPLPPAKTNQEDNEAHYQDYVYNASLDRPLINETIVKIEPIEPTENQKSTGMTVENYDDYNSDSSAINEAIIKIEPIQPIDITVEENKNPLMNSKDRKRPWSDIQDEYDAVGYNVATKLRKLSPNMRIIAEKLINAVLFEAQIESLTNSSAIALRSSTTYFFNNKD